jgi:hypothetical protein
LHHIALQAESAQAQRDHGKGRQRGVPGYRSWEGFQNRGGAGGRTPPGEKGNGRCCRPHRGTPRWQGVARPSRSMAPVWRSHLCRKALNPQKIID